MKKATLLILFCVTFTGSAWSQFIADLAGYPLVTTGWNIGGFASVVDSTIELTTPSTTESGYVYFDSLVNLTYCAQFTVKFDFQIIPTGFSTVADGIAFWYINNPPSGFITGGGIGLPSFPNGLILILDTYDNDGDGNNPSETLLYYDGTVSGYTEGSATGRLAPVVPRQSFIDDASWHHCELDYNAGNINVYFDYSLIPSLTGYYVITIPGGYFGFSSSTGAAYSTQSVKNIHITATGLSTPPAVTSPITYCQYATADTLIATGSPGSIIRWFTTDTATIVSLPGSPRPNTSVPGTTKYFVRQGIGPCTSAPDSVIVIVTPQPLPPVITGTTKYCTGETAIPFTVTGAGGASFLWYTTGTGGSGSGTAITASTTAAGVTSYWVSQTVGGCESVRQSITVTVNTTPAAPTIAGTTTYCQYDTYIPPTATGINILWYEVATGGISGTTPPLVNTSVAGTYTIYATQTDTGCESPRAPFSITVKPKPVPPVIVDVPDNYCPGQTFVPFTIISGSGVLWYDDAVTGSGTSTPPTINTAISGVYTVWATQTVLGCESDRVPITVTVYDSVKAAFTYDIHYGCKADTIAFTNTSTGTTDYLWNFGDLSASVVKSPTHLYPYQEVDTVTLYAYTGTCVDSMKDTISLLHPLHAIFSADSTIICQGKTVVFTDSSVGALITHFWNFADGETTGTELNPSHTYPHTGTYKVYEVVTDSIPCHDTAYKTIFVDSISPISIVITDSVFCRSTSTTVTGLYTNIGNTGVTWALGDGNGVSGRNPVQYGYDTTGTFTITVTALYRACPAITTSRTVTVLPQPHIFIGHDTTICKGSNQLQLIDILNATNPKATWEWSTGATTAGIDVVQPGTYTATVRLDGCAASATVRVVNDCYMNIPNVFTPNGDGLNDYFFPRQFLSAGLISFGMQIYNRWGELIFEANALDGRGWDGKFNNTDQPSGVYVYIIDGVFKDGQKEHHQGNVTLLR